jgi:hypothetical protein
LHVLASTSDDAFKSDSGWADESTSGEGQVSRQTLDICKQRETREIRS